MFTGMFMATAYASPGQAAGLPGPELDEALVLDALVLDVLVLDVLVLEALVLDALVLVELALVEPALVEPALVEPALVEPALDVLGPVVVVLVVPVDPPIPPESAGIPPVASTHAPNPTVPASPSNTTKRISACSFSRAPLSRLTDTNARGSGAGGAQRADVHHPPEPDRAERHGAGLELVLLREGLGDDACGEAGEERELLGDRGGEVRGDAAA
jgi:hypothetical protein